MIDECMMTVMSHSVSIRDLETVVAGVSLETSLLSLIFPLQFIGDEHEYFLLDLLGSLIHSLL